MRHFLFKNRVLYHTSKQFLRLRVFGIKVFLPAMIILTMVYLTYHLIQGQYGIRSYLKLSAQQSELQQQYLQLKKQHDILAHRVHLLSDDVLDYDLLEERALIVLKLIPENYAIIHMQDIKS